MWLKSWLNSGDVQNQQQRRSRHDRRKRAGLWPYPLAMEPLEDRTAPAVDLNPALEPHILNGLNTVSATANAVDQLDQFVSSLPVVGQSIGGVLDFGGKIQNELIAPIQNYLAANDPTSSTELVNALNAALDLAGSPINLTDESAGGVLKVRVTDFSFSETEEDLPINFGDAATALNLDLGAQLDFTPKVSFGVTGGVGFAFGFDLDPTLSPSEAFFLDLTGTALEFSVETPFAGQGTPAPLDFTLDLGMLGSVQVTDGQVDLNANLAIAFPDPVLTAQELSGSPITSLVTVSGSGGLAVTLPISATLAGTSIGSANLAVALTGDVFGDFDIDVDIDAAAPDIAQAFKNFTNMTPGDLVGSLTELANNLQALVNQFDLPAGIPFVEDAISDAVDFANRVQALTDSLFDLGLQGGIEVVLGALNGTATFDVVIDGAPTAISINLASFTDLQSIADEINDQLGALASVEAAVEEGRLSLRALNETVQTLTFANVNSVASSILGFVNDQAGIPFFDFVTFDEFEDVVAGFLPGFTIDYDATTQLITFDLDLFGSESRTADLNFSREIDLGGLATLSLAGSGEANLAVAARLRLSAGLDLTPLTPTTKLTDLNGGLGVRTNGTADADLNVTLADGSVIGIDLDGLGVDPTVADLIARISSATGGKLEATINFTQDGLVLRDTTKTPGSGDLFLVAAASSAAVADLGFGIGANDLDDDGRIEGGTIISRFFLVPFNSGTGAGSFAAVGLDASATDLRLGAALGILQVALTGGTLTPIAIDARGALLDPDSSGKIFLNELIGDPAAAVDVGFGTFAGAGLTGAFTGFAVGDTLGSFELALEFVDADTFGIDLGGELASLQIDVEVASVAGLIPSLTADVDIDTASLPNFSDLLSSFENLSIPEIISLVADLVVQFQDFPLFATKLPVLDQSIGDVISFVSDKINDILGDFATVRDDLEALLNATLTALQEQAATLVIDGQSLANGLVAIGPELQHRLFHALEDLLGAVQAIPADFDIRFDAGQAELINLAAMFRALREVIGEVGDLVPGSPAAAAVVDFFTTPIPSIPALAGKSFVGLIASKIPSGDRVVELVMNALGLDLFDLADAGNVAILNAVTAARDAVDTALDNLPDLPDGDLGSAILNTARDNAQAALDDAVAALGEVFTRLEQAVDNLDVFAALRSVQYLVDAIADVKLALLTLAEAGNPIFDTAIADLTAFLTTILSDVRDRVFDAFPLGALTFSMPDPGTLLFNLHFSLAPDPIAVDVEFDLEDAGLPAIVPLDVQAGVTGQLAVVADFSFGFGFDLDPDSTTFLQPFLDRTSEIALTADVDLEVNGTAGIGGFSIDIVNGVIKLKDTIDLGGDGAVGGGDDTFGGPARLSLGLIDPDASDKGIFFSEISPSIFDPDLAATLLVDLPVEVSGVPVGNLTAFASFSDFNFGTIDFDIPNDLIDEIINGLTELNLANILAGLRTIITTIADGLQSDLVGKLPLIGDNLDDLAATLDKLDTQFLQPFEAFVAGLSGTAQEILEALQQIVFNTIGPGDLNFLVLDPNFDGDPLLTFADVPIAFTGTDITDPLALTFPEAGYEFDLTFGFDEMFELPLDLNLTGLGLGLTSDTVINVRVAPTIDVSFGLNRLEGFYVNLDNADGQTGASIELEVFLDPASSLELKLFFLNLSASVAPGGEVGFATTATLAFVTDDPSGKLTFTSLDEFNPAFTLTAIANVNVIFEATLADNPNLPSIAAGLNIVWDFSLADGGVSNSFAVDYTGITLDLGDFFRENTAPVIDTLNQFFAPLQEIFEVINSEIPVISELSQLLGQGPVTFIDLLQLLGSGYKELGDFLSTLAEISELITTITSIANDLGDGIIEFGDLSFDGTALDAIDFTDGGVRSLVKGFDDAAALNKTAADILSQFSQGVKDSLDGLKGGSVGGSVGFTNGAFHFPIIEDPFGTVAGFLMGQTSDLVVWDLPDFVAEFSFKQLFGPIFPPIPLFVSIFGSFRFATDFAIGFDTRGIQQSFADFYKGFYFRDWADTNGNGILDPGETTEARELGLDLEFGAGAELNVVVASAGVEGGINAAITADWNDVLEDGKFYIDEVGQRLSQGIECIFDLSGQLEAFLRAFVKIGFDTPFGFVTLFEESLDLVRVTLLDFSLSCPPLPIPQPGSLVGDQVLLNIGDRAGQRQPGATDVAEIVEVFGERDLDPSKNVQLIGVTDLDGDGDIDSDDVDEFVAGGGTLSADIDLNGDNKIDIDEARLIEDFNANGTIGTTTGDKQSVLLIGFGQWQVFLNVVTEIVGNGGNEDDQILFDHSVQVQGSLTGGVGNDKLQGGQAGDFLFGDDGEDILIGGFGNDEIHGGALDDQIFGNAGSDLIFGDDGNDTIAGDDGNNVQPVNLELNGDPVLANTLVPLDDLNDTIFGGSGEDNILGEFGDDDLYGQSGADQLAGGWGDDLLNGGADPDLLEGNEGSDDIFGEGGNDIIFGEADGISTANDGDDFMDGGTEDDTIRDDHGADTAIGGFGNDFIVTGVDNDVIFGDLDPRSVLSVGFNGQDVIFGDRDALPALDDGLGLGNGADYIEGGGNSDEIHGGAGGDRIIGGGSPFSGTTFGGTDAGDLIFGGSGDDIIAGDNATIGTAGDVTSTGDVTTFADGGAGVDTVHGSDGADKIFGGGAGDILNGDESGGTDPDIVVGDQGTYTATKLEALHSDVAGSGGKDTIQGVGGNDILLGGDDDDTIFGNLGDDKIAGDNATVTFASGVVVRVATRDEAHGGDDLINGDQGADIVFGGTGNDTISGGGVLDEADILFGDNGEAVLQDGSADENDLFSTDPTLGGTDIIFGGVGNDIIVGGSGGNDTTGTGGDDLAGQAGDDIVVGDNVRINRTDGANPVVEFIKSIFGDKGGDDDIFGNAGLDILIGGFGSDEVEGNGNDDILVGDNAAVYFVDDPSTPEVEGDSDITKLDLIRSFTDGLGHTDTLSGNAGADVAIGGTAGDAITGDNATASAGAGDLVDILLGDNGDVVLLDLAFFPGTGTDAITIRGGTVAVIRATDENTSTGGIDTISGNAAGDVIIGGVLGDTLYGDAATPGAFDGGDTMLGDNGRMEWHYDGDPAFAGIETGFTFDNSLTTLDLITTELPAAHPGGRDLMLGHDGKDVMFGGEDADTMSGDDGDQEAATATGDRDVMFGDHGRLYPQESTLPDFPSHNFFAIDTGDAANGEGDRMWGEEGDDVMLGQQGDDRMFGNTGDDDMIGGHNVAGGVDELSDPAIEATLNPAVNDLMDGGSGDDAMAGDNAVIWRRGDDLSPRFRLLTGNTIYTTTNSTITTNVGGAAQSDPNDAVGRDITMLDHADTTATGLFGADVMAGGAGSDVLFGELGNDLMQGDGFIGANDNNADTITHQIVFVDSGANPDTDQTLYFNIPEATSDGDDYLEGNGGSDLMYGGLGQDDLVGGSSALFGLTTEAQRPDGSDTIFGGAGVRIARNDEGDPASLGHSRDADFIMGDNANVFRLVNGSDLFRVFAYDNYGGTNIVVRAMQQLDYTLGGADFAGGTYTNGAANADNGAADLIYGEDGDDVIFGMTGSDVLFANAQDDDVIGGYGHDWTSGGTGQDGVVGDDGLIFTSRNGTAETLYGILATTQQIISTPGSIQIATINVTGELKKTVDLTPFSFDPTWDATDDEFPDNSDASPFADDIIFGGLGSDFLHGGSGDDAISGAEALEHAYVPVFDGSGNPIGILDLGYDAVGLPANASPGDVLAFNPEDTDGQHLNNRFRPGEFFLYDEYDPLRQILLTGTGELSKDGTGFAFLLNFDETEGVFQPGGVTPKPHSFTYDPVHDDGSDVIFGDNGNDWLVGGTGRDNLYGGWGNDLLNADDDQTTNGTLNDTPDTHPTYEDRAYGGAGRDVLIANTGGDRLIDWVGEYNAYLVPFAPFGMASVSRTLQPHLHEFLYALSKADGADPTRATDTGSDPARNGEPAGELGLVLQKDFAWQDQTGAPSDPQAGNIPGGKRDVLRSADFNNTQGNPQTAGFFTDSGIWEMTGGKLQVAAESPKADALSVYNVNDYLPNYYEIRATIQTLKPTGGWKANAYIVFDYFSPTDFKFAGIDVSTNKIVVGYRAWWGWAVVAQTNMNLRPDTFYNLLVAVNGTNVIVQVDGASSFSYTFAPRIIDGSPYGLNQGMVGFGSDSARGSFDSIAVQVLPPQLTFEHAETFDDGVANLFTGPRTGTWQVQLAGGNGRYVGTPPAGDDHAVSLVDLGIGRGLLSDSYLELSVRLNTQGIGGFVFDSYGPDEFKFVALDVTTGRVVIGHHTDRGGWVVDRWVAQTLTPGTDYVLGVSIKGSTVSVTLNGLAVLGHAFNAVAVDGGFGLLSRGGVSSFDEVAIRTDDPAFEGPDNMMAAAPAPSAASPVQLSEQELKQIVEEAIRRIAVAPGSIDALSSLRVAIADLPGQILGQTHGTTVYIDKDAAGHGWFVDPTPEDDSEFRLPGDQGEQSRMDLLSVVLHELGHVLGDDHEEQGAMKEDAEPGIRIGVAMDLDSTDEPELVAPPVDESGLPSETEPTDAEPVIVLIAAGSEEGQVTGEQGGDYIPVTETTETGPELDGRVLMVQPSRRGSGPGVAMDLRAVGQEQASAIVAATNTRADKGRSQTATEDTSPELMSIAVAAAGVAQLIATPPRRSPIRWEGLAADDEMSDLWGVEVDR